MELVSGGAYSSLGSLPQNMSPSLGMSGRVFTGPSRIAVANLQVPKLSLEVRLPADFGAPFWFLLRKGMSAGNMRAFFR